MKTIIGILLLLLCSCSSKYKLVEDIQATEETATEKVEGKQEMSSTDVVENIDISQVEDKEIVIVEYDTDKVDDKGNAPVKKKTTINSKKVTEGNATTEKSDTTTTLESSMQNEQSTLTSSVEREEEQETKYHDFLRSLVLVILGCCLFIWLWKTK